MLHFKSLISSCNTSVSNKLLELNRQGNWEERGKGGGKKYPVEVLAYKRCFINIILECKIYYVCTSGKNFKILNPKEQGITLTGPANLRPYVVNKRWLGRVMCTKQMEFPSLGSYH